MSGGEPSALPTLETVRDRARELAATVPTGRSVNVLAVPVDGSDPLAGVERIDDRYVGERAAQAGLLAAAVEAVAETADARLHWPDPDFTADGPWIVLSPLGGRLATVTRGTARVTVEIDRERAGAHRSLAIDDERLSTILDAARPDHGHYPVEDDDVGVFTTGMTTFSLSSVDTDGETLTVVLDAETTPATTASEIEGRFADLDGVRVVRVDPTTGADRGALDADLRSAVERAHVETLGDAEYVWLPPGSPLAHVPGGDKVALGTGTPDEAFTQELYDECVTLLSRSLAGVARSLADGREERADAAGRSA